MAIVWRINCLRVVNEGRASLCLCLYHHPRGVVKARSRQLSVLAGTSRDLRGRQGLLFSNIVTALRSYYASRCLKGKLRETLHKALHLVVHSLSGVEL